MKTREIWLKLAVTIICLIKVRTVSSQPPALVPKIPGGTKAPGDPLEPFCEPDAEIPDDLIQCGSCQNRCGTKTNPRDLQSPGKGATCSCDLFCGYHGDCCQDFHESCPKESQKFEENTALYPSLFNHTDFKCFSFQSDYLKWTKKLNDSHMSRWL